MFFANSKSALASCLVIFVPLFVVGAGCASDASNGSGGAGSSGQTPAAGNGGAAITAGNGALGGTASALAGSQGNVGVPAAGSANQVGAGGSAGAAGTTGQAGGGLVDPGPCKPRPLATEGDEVFYCSGVAQWEIYDKAEYTKFKSNFDEIIKLLDQGYAAIAKRTGQSSLELPIRVTIGEDTCCGGWAGGGDVGYNSGDFEDEGGMDWIRGVVLGEVVNAVTGTVADNWPSDWWVNSVWYFPGFVAVDVLREVSGSARATKWETDEKYPTYPIYNLFLALKTEKDWKFYQDFFNSVKKEKISWADIGDNPSAIKTNYVIAYMSLAYGQNLGARFVATAKAPGADAAVVQSIMDAHAKLVAADAANKDTSSAWDKFRGGDYAGASSGL
jgi:hypothetical protein